MTESQEHTAESDAPKEDGSCSLLCHCPTPLTREEIDALHEMGLF